MMLNNPITKSARTLILAIFWAGFLFLWSGMATADNEFRPAPEAEFETTDGTTESLQDYRGQVVVFNIWGTWCPPCVREIPHLVEVQQAIESRGGTVIGLAVASGSAEEIHAFWRDRLELEPAYPLWIGTQQQARGLFEAYGLPNTLIIDRDGLIRERFLGMVTHGMLMDALQPLLRGSE